MARFDVYVVGADTLLDVQTDLISHISTRLVIPLIPTSRSHKPMARLNPVFELDGVPHVLETQFMGPVEQRHLGRPTDNLIRHYDEIVAAIDMIFLGF